ncbi:tetraspanin-8-like [Genypterus blacodes]|uniref:tetraspanin-8-like n=1 Tax=Genypterus blacodes TaxID=154954 RepID=UPI003F75CD75
MQRTAVIVVADKTSLKRPFVFLNAVNVALCFFMLAVTVAAHQYVLQAGKIVSFVSGMVLMYILEISCLLLSLFGVCGACREKRWCLILFALGMTGASQTMIVKSALSYQRVYEAEVLRKESVLLSMMPLSGISKANRTLLNGIQAHYKCCGIVGGYKDWGSTIPTSCLCEYPGRCVRLPGISTVGAPKNQFVYQEPCLPVYGAARKREFAFAMSLTFGSGVFWGCLLVMSIMLMVQIKRKKEFMALLHTNNYLYGTS